MSSTDSSALKSLSFSKGLVISLALIAFVVSILSSLSFIRRFFTSDIQERKVLAKVFTEVEDSSFVILKIQTQSGIDIEIYEKNAGSYQQNIKQKFNLTGDTEAHLTTDENSVSLALTDVDKDGYQDIIAPTFDKQGQSRLNVFKFDQPLKQFSPAINGE